ncbi:MAG: hypothetical protein C0467_03765 [Planctomycetaceae bacterium]|nr:hypothetical protein [Planctomycetaceae bacterium]
MVSPERIESMQTAWVRLLDRFGVAIVDAYPPFDALVAAYTGPDRHYHNLEHLSEVFRVASRLAVHTDDHGALQLAIWFHDVVYDPLAKDNEVRSADVANELLEPLHVPTATIEKVQRLVRATAHLLATAPPTERDAAVLLDADLAILGASEERYRRYAADVRREYAFVPDPEYRTGRAAVLQRFLDRPRIFLHQVLVEEGEERARKNMLDELTRLRAD